MINTEARNRKIIHLIESVIRDHCRIYNTNFESNEEGIIVCHNNEPLYILGIEFSESDFEIHFNGVVFYYFPMSQKIKLKNIYKEDEDLTEFLKNNEMGLWFFEDEHLMTKRITQKKYKDYSILKTAFAIELFEQINNTITIRNHLTDLLKEREGILAN